MNSRFLVSAVATFCVLFLMDFIIHGVLLTELYAQTASLWRPKAEMVMPAMLLGQVILALVTTYIFTKNYEGKGLSEGGRFGLYVGMLLGAIQIGTYAYMPIPLSLTMSWVIANVVIGLGMGMTLALTYKK